MDDSIYTIQYCTFSCLSTGTQSNQTPIYLASLIVGKSERFVAIIVHVDCSRSYQNYIFGF